MRLFYKLFPLIYRIFRPSGQKQFNTAIFPPTTDPTLIEFENAITSNNLMYMMKVLAQDCGNQELWGRGLACGKAAMEGSLEPFSVGRRMVSSLCRAAGRLHSTWGVASERFHVVKGAGHLPMLDHPEEVVRIVSVSLQGVLSKILYGSFLIK
eukprot:Em0018g867a